MRLFKGTFVGCDVSGLDPAALVSVMNEFGLSKETYVKAFHESDCLAAGGLWKATVDQNFDNVAAGLLSLFEIATTEGWVRGVIFRVRFSSKYCHVVYTAVGTIPELRGKTVVKARKYVHYADLYYWSTCQDSIRPSVLWCKVPGCKSLNLAFLVV